MFRINNNDFKILGKYKKFLNDLDDLLENVPRKDMYHKDYIRNLSLELLELILKVSYNSNLIDTYYASIKGDIAMLDFLLERLFIKKYISEKSLYKIGSDLVELNKMITGWLNNVRN